MRKRRQSGHKRRRAGQRALAETQQAIPSAGRHAVEPSPRVAFSGAGHAPATAKGPANPAPATLQNKYVRAELKRITIIGGAMIMFLIVLSFFLN